MAEIAIRQVIKINKIFLSASVQENNYTDDNSNEEFIQQKFIKSIFDKSANKAYIGLNNKTDSLQTIVNKSNNFGAMYHISSHSNACDGNDNVTSTDVYYHSLRGLKLAEYFKKLMIEFMPDRKINIYTDRRLYKNGLYELNKTNAVAILIENYWHDSTKDIAYWTRNYAKFQNVYQHLIYRLITGMIKF